MPGASIHKALTIVNVYVDIQEMVYTHVQIQTNVERDHILALQMPIVLIQSARTTVSVNMDFKGMVGIVQMWTSVKRDHIHAIQILSV